MSKGVRLRPLTKIQRIIADVLVFLVILISIFALEDTYAVSVWVAIPLAALFGFLTELVIRFIIFWFTP